MDGSPWSLILYNWWKKYMSSKYLPYRWLFSRYAHSIVRSGINSGRRRGINEYSAKQLEITSLTAVEQLPIDIEV